jgi:signal transduction histidine kinase/ActR/RegA family two-component response regulator
MLQNYKEQYLDAKTQSILLDVSGTVIESDNVLYKLSPKAPIAALHPFFISIPELIQNTNETYLFSCVHLNQEENHRICDVKLTTFANKKHALLSIKDLTKEYQGYQKLMQARNESVIKAELLALKNVQLKEQEAFKNRFIANFSHELRTPLTSIMVFANLLGKSNLSDEQKEYVNLIKDSSKNLKLMLEDTLNISKIESGNLELHNKLFNLSGLLEYLKSVYTAKAAAKGLTFTVIYDDKIPEQIEGDHLRLNQILTNLLENALKFTPQGSVTLKVSLNQTRANKANLKFEVRDTGIGIKEEDINNVFKSFTQLNTDYKHQGTGLGLAIAKRLLELMKSEIKVKSVPNQGSNFYFNVNFKYPVTSSQKKETPKKPKTNDDILSKFKDKKFKILLVEDDQITQLLVFKVLADTQRFFIDVLSDGKNVIEELENNEYDAILMDINLPTSRGYEVSKQIRQHKDKKIKQTPVIGLTANTLPEDVKKYKKHGMNDVISKPFDEETLVRTLLVNIQ